jgi:flagellar protein FlbD
MIHLTRLNGQPLLLNCDLIKLIENAPDTVITLVNGEKIIVRDSEEEILGRIVEFRRRILNGLEASLSSWAARGAEGTDVLRFKAAQTEES